MRSSSDFWAAGNTGVYAAIAAVLGLGISVAYILYK